MSERVGLNIASMLPWSALPVVGLPLTAWMTRKAGYAFWQVLPLRSVTIGGLQRTGVPVRFVEPAWNATTFLGHLRGELGSEGMPTTWLDPLFFPSPEECLWRFNQFFWYTEATLVYHNLGVLLEWPGGGIELSWKERSLVEVHPELGMSARELVAAWGSRTVPTKPYVIDLCHLRRSIRGGDDSPLRPWRGSLEVLLPYVALVHIQALDLAEAHRFLKGESTTLELMLQVICSRGYEGPFVVEFDPRAFGPVGLLPFKLAENLRLVRERIEGVL